MHTFKPSFTRRHFLAWTGAIAGTRFCAAFADSPAGITPQPYFAAVNRVVEALAKLGAPVSAEHAARIAALTRQNDSAAVDAAEKILDAYTLTRVTIESDGYPRAVAGGAERTLVEQGWRLFLIRVSNPDGKSGKLGLAGWPDGFSSWGSSQRPGMPDALTAAPSIAQTWLASELYDEPPMAPALTGFAVEYRVIQLYSRDRGRRSTYTAFSFASDGSMKAALGVYAARRGVALDFNCLPSRDVTLRVIDADGRGCMASLTFKDRIDRVYPSQAMRLAPDMRFQPQIYRADGESVRLPDGEYTVESKRGPEYLRGTQTVTIGDGRESIEVRLKRWIDPAEYGFYSGDTHIHAGGCAHYDNPTAGVSPETMIRHVRGEGLSIGDVLTWGPSYYYQKQFFTGRAESPSAGLEHPELQAANNANLKPQPTPKDSESLLRYDVETSMFPSSHCGHMVLLRLAEQDYPGTKLLEDWPSWNLPILKWARDQGSVAGYAHCALMSESTELPNYDLPFFQGIGGSESVVDVTHGYVDFLSGCEMLPVYELNSWYHMLNCGFRLAMIGETDFPCITGDRPGVGRSYVKLDRRPVDNEGYDEWVRNLQKGKLYCGDGRSHILSFTVNKRPSGEEDVSLAAPGKVAVTATVAAWLEPELTAETRAIVESPPFMTPGWHLERARIGASRDVTAELVVNGVAVDRTVFTADGKPRTIRFKAAIARSSWVALRILPSSHSHPIFVKVGNKPIRASRKSAQWCRASVDKLWDVKSPFMRESERPAALEAFDHAKVTYDRIIGECEGE